MNQVIPRLWLASSIALGCLLTVNSVRAQILPDNTLPVNSRVTPGCIFCRIDGGTVRGVNLFHSFSEFSVPTGGAAFFNNGLQIQNIFSRVTANSVSNIDGVLRANGTANLFLLNPNGIIFGAKASLNIGGSFVASTASSLLFADGTVLGAKLDASTPPLLSVSVPLGLQYGSHPGSVEVRGAILGVDSGQTLALVGGNVQLNGGALFTPFAPPGGRVELGGLAGEGTIGLSNNGSYLSLSFPDGVTRGDVSISNGAIVDVRAGGGGSIAINARNVNITGGSTQLLAGIGSGFGSVGSQAGDIEINATQATNLDASVIFTVVTEGGVGNGGDINITTGSLAVTGGGQLSASTGGEGKAGNVIINARDTVAFDGVGSDGFSSAAYSRVEEGAIGDGGNINITTGSLAVTGGAQISVSTGGEGLAGSVIITASDRVAFDGVGSNGISSGAYSRVEETGIGNGGDININTGSLSITNGAEGTVSNLGTDNAGNLVVRANSINLDNSGKLTAESVTGSGGNIHLTTTDLLLLRRNSLISALSGTSGSNGIDGNINIDTKFLIAVPKENSDIVATGFGRTPGSNIQVNAESIFGTQFRQQQTPESDIVASGTVKLNISYVDPNQGLVNLPGTLVDHTNQIDQGCSAGAANRENKFTVTGRGGLPQSPNEVLTPDMVQDDFGTPVASNPPTRDSVSPTPTSAPKQLVEAQGWVVNDLGVVTLVAAAPSVTPHSGALVDFGGSLPAIMQPKPYPCKST